MKAKAIALNTGGYKVACESVNGLHIYESADFYEDAGGYDPPKSIFLTKEECKKLKELLNKESE